MLPDTGRSPDDRSNKSLAVILFHAFNIVMMFVLSRGEISKTSDLPAVQALNNDSKMQALALLKLLSLIMGSSKFSLSEPTTAWSPFEQPLVS